MTEDLQLEMNEYLPLRDVVFQTLRKAIFQGKLKPGERLMEIHLSAQLGVSRTPVREAIRMLELEGLVNVEPRKGAVVASITEKDLKDVLEVREALEELAVRKACQNIREEEIRELDNAAARFIRCLKEGNVVESANADVSFHEIISEATGNRRLIQIPNNIREQIYRYRLENVKDTSTHEQLVREHAEICAALKARSEEEAVEAIRCHIENQKSSILAQLKMEPASPGK